MIKRLIIRVCITTLLILLFIEGSAKIIILDDEISRRINAAAISAMVYPHNYQISDYGEPRLTTGQPERYAHTIHMFGNSSLRGVLIADADTIPSRLQAMLKDYRIVNHGMVNVTAHAELSMLKEMTLQPGDLVIFYDGIVDANWISIHESVGYCDRMNLLAILTLICRTLPLPTTCIGAAEVNAYQDALYEAQSWLKSQGVAFYTVLQSHLITRPLTPDEQRLVDNQPRGDAGKLWALTVCWQRFEQVNRILHGLNLTHVLDKSRNEQAMWIDSTHGGDVANNIIARAIYDYLTIF